MDSDTVDTTDRISDRFKRPGPRKQPMVDLKYITFGFSYLQVRFAVVKKIFDTFYSDRLEILHQIFKRLQQKFYILGYVGTCNHKCSDWKESFRDSWNHPKPVSIPVLYQVLFEIILFK